MNLELLDIADRYWLLNFLLQRLVDIPYSPFRSSGPMNPNRPELLDIADSYWLLNFLL